MSKRELRAFLSAHTKEQVIDIMLELYDARKEAKEYLDFRLSPNDGIELEKCKDIIRMSSSLSEVVLRTPRLPNAER